MRNRFGGLCLAIFSIAFCLRLRLAAQDLDDVTITGQVTDPNGLAVVGATVKATHVADRCRTHCHDRRRRPLSDRRAEAGHL